MLRNIDFIKVEDDKVEFLEKVEFFSKKGIFETYEECFNFYADKELEEIEYRNSFYLKENEKEFEDSPGKVAFDNVNHLFNKQFFRYIPQDEVVNVSKVLKKVQLRDSLLTNNNISVRLGKLELTEELLNLIKSSKSDLHLIKNLYYFKYMYPKYGNFVSLLILDFHSFVLDEALDIKNQPFGDVLSIIEFNSKNK